MTAITQRIGLHDVERLLGRWFGDGEDDAAVAARQAGLWWGRSPETDLDIGAAFGDVASRAAAGTLDHWTGFPRGRLALVLALDQLPRMIHRARTCLLRRPLLPNSRLASRRLNTQPPHRRFRRLRRCPPCAGPAPPAPRPGSRAGGPACAARRACHRSGGSTVHQRAPAPHLQRGGKYPPGARIRSGFPDGDGDGQ